MSTLKHPTVQQCLYQMHNYLVVPINLPHRIRRPHKPQCKGTDPQPDKDKIQYIH